MLLRELRPRAVVPHSGFLDATLRGLVGGSAAEVEESMRASLVAAAGSQLHAAAPSPSQRPGMRSAGVVLGGGQPVARALVMRDGHDAHQAAAGPGRPEARECRKQDSSGASGREVPCAVAGQGSQPAGVGQGKRRREVWVEGAQDGLHDCSTTARAYSGQLHGHNGGTGCSGKLARQAEQQAPGFGMMVGVHALSDPRSLVRQLLATAICQSREHGMPPPVSTKDRLRWLQWQYAL